MKLTKDNISLILANLLPFVGIAFFGWSLFNFLFLYWLESAVIGFYFILKTIKMAQYRGGSYGAMLVGQTIFFFFHFGGFMLGHFILIYSFSKYYQSTFDFSVIGLIFLLINILSLFISHGISYKENFIGKREYEKTMGLFIFAGPYDRLFVMQTAAMLGAIFVTAWGWPLYVVVIIKIIADYVAHNRSHRTEETIANVSKVFDQLGEDLNSGKVIAMGNEEYSKLLTERFNKVSEDPNT